MRVLFVQKHSFISTLHTFFLILSYEKNLLINQVDNKLDLSSSLTLSIHAHVRLYLCIIKLFITFSIIIFCLYFARFCEKNNNTYQWCVDGKGEITLITDMIMIHIWQFFVNLVCVSYAIFECKLSFYFVCSCKPMYFHFFCMYAARNVLK